MRQSTKQPNLANESDWIERARQGERHAFDRLLGHYRGSLYGYLLTRINDPDAVEDLIQETWLKVFRSITQFRAEGSFRSWLCAIAQNNWKNYLRTENRERYDQTFDVHTQEIAAEELVEEQVIAQQEQSRLHQAMVRLPAKQRRTVHMRLTEQMPFVEIARHMRCSVSTAKNNHYFGIRSIQQILAE